jgi:hypothetical protein
MTRYGTAGLAASARRGWGTLRDCVTSPADAWLLLRMGAWAICLPALKYAMPLPRLVRLMARPARRAERDRSRERRIVALSRLVYTPLVRADIGCLQRSLLAYRFLSAAGAAPSLIVGVNKRAGMVTAHAWVELDGEPGGEPRGFVSQFIPTLRFGSGGSPLSMSTTASGMRTWTLGARRPEHELLVACARVDGARSSSVAALVRQPLDWNLVLATAVPHGMLALLADAVGALAEDDAAAVPEAVRERLRATLRRNAWKNVFLSGELLKVLDVLADAGIAAVPYKGPSLAAHAYGNVALRQFGDIDVLVHDHERMRARDVLLERGFTLFTPWTRAQEFNHEINLVGSDGAVRLDVHGETFPQAVLALDPAGLWARVRTTQLLGRAIPAFSPEDLLLVLCVHADSHQWERLAWVADIAHMIRAEPALDWEALLERAQRSGSGRILGVGVLLAVDLLGASVPPEVEASARAWRRVSELTRGIIAGMFEPRDDGSRGDFARSMFQLRSRDRLRDRVRLLATPNEGDWEALPLPAAAYPLYYLLRPIRLVMKYGAARLRGGRNEA